MIIIVFIATAQHVALFQQLEEESDILTFFGHARHPKQKLTIMVAAHKVKPIPPIYSKLTMLNAMC